MSIQKVKIRKDSEENGIDSVEISIDGKLIEENITSYKFSDTIEEIPTLDLNMFAHPAALEIETEADVECRFDWDGIPEEIMQQMYDSLRKEFGDVNG